MVSAKKLVLFVIVALVAACSDRDDEDCSLVLCEANEIIRLEFLVNGTNPLADGTYSREDVSIIGKTPEPLEVAILTDITGATEALLEVKSPDWIPGEYFYTVTLGDDWSVPIEVRFTRSKSNDPCCGERLEILSLESDAYQVEGNTGFYTVILQ